MKPPLLSLLLGCLLPTPSQAALAPKPNVILVITDDQGYGDLSGHGNPVLKTPNLDQLRHESVRLTDFHVTPMCTPTRGQLMTGRYCLANGAMNVSSGRTLLRRGIPTMPEIFATGGYRTGHFGKWHLGDNYPYRPMDRGFQEAVWFPSSHIGSAPDHWNNDYFDDVYNHNGRRQSYQGFCTDVFFGEAIQWMRARAATGQPFFCYIAPNAPHGPLFVPQKYRDLYAGQPRNVASFFGMIANIDENLGKLDSFLRESGLRENTVLIFMTDNGGTAGVNVFNAGLRGRKIDLYDGGHRVPCFIRWPAGGLRAVGDAGELTVVQDLLPTLIDLCGLKKPAEARFDGLSLARLLRGEEQRLADRMVTVQFSRMNDPVPKKGDAAVLWQKWRLVQDKELYDLSGDPAQQKNAIEQHPEIAAQMRAHYDQWWGQVEPRLNEHSAIIVGSDAENPVQLSPADWQDIFLDQGAQVRRGEKKNGAWNIEVARAGEYEIELRRWAREAEAAISAGLAPFKHADGEFPAGVGLPITKARIRIGSIDQIQPVGQDDKAVTFTLTLESGRTRLQTWFYDSNSQQLGGAYYVYVRRK